MLFLTKVNRMFKLIAGAALIYAAYCVVLFFAQRYMLFPSYMIPTPSPPDFKALRIEPWWLETSFGKVEAWYLPPAAAGKPAPAVIFGHGNGELIDYWPNELAPVLVPGHRSALGGIPRLRPIEGDAIAGERCRDVYARLRPVGCPAGHRSLPASSCSAARSAAAQSATWRSRGRRRPSFSCPPSKA